MGSRQLGNPDLKRLQERGYAITIDSGHLVIRHIPYLDHACELQWGAIVTVLTFIDEDRVTQKNHQVFFAGRPPHDLAGVPIRNLGDRPANVQLSKACVDEFARKQEMDRRVAYYEGLYPQSRNWIRDLWGWIRRRF